MSSREEHLTPQDAERVERIIREARTYVREIRADRPREEAVAARARGGRSRSPNGASAVPAGSATPRSSS